MFISDDSLRAMYAGGRGNATAQRFSRCWARVFAPRYPVFLVVPDPADSEEGVS
jgi:hypothetical protein